MLEGWMDSVWGSAQSLAFVGHPNTVVLWGVRLGGERPLPIHEQKAEQSTPSPLP